MRPLRGKGRARSRPAPLRPLRAAFLGRGCGAFFLRAAACRRLPPPAGVPPAGAVLGPRCLGFACAAGSASLPPARTVARPGALLRWWPWGSPLRPSRPRRPRWGLRGSVRPPALGAPAPGPAGLPAAPGCFRYVQNFGHIALDFCRLPWYSVLVRPVPLLRGLPLAWYPWTAGKAQSKDWAFFHAFFRLRRLCRGSDSPAVNWISRTRCGLLPPVNNPEIVNLILVSRFVGGLSSCPRPANATKPLSFCCVRWGFLLDSLTSCPTEPLRPPLATFGGFVPVLALSKIMVLFRSPF